MRLEIPFCGPTYKHFSRFISPAECVNFYPAPYPDVGSDRYALIGTPGLEEWVDLSSVGSEVRGVISDYNRVYAVVDDNFVVVEYNGSYSVKGPLSTTTGRVGISTNGVDIIVVDGPYGYTYDLSTLTWAKIADPDFPGGKTVAFVDGYYLVVPTNTGQIYRSDYNDGTSWNPLAFSSAGGDPDNAVSIVADHLDLWVLGDYTGEIFTNVGSGTFNFARVDGAFMEQGIMSPHAVCKANNAIYWLGQDRNGFGQIFQGVGGQPKVVSDEPISYLINQMTTTLDTFSFSYQQDGRTFVVFTFPTEDVTLVYDSSTGLWHTRSSRIGGLDRRWRVNCHTVFQKNHVAGDFTSGKLYRMKTDVYDEDGGDIISVRTTPLIREKQDRITVDEAHVLFEPGVGLITGDAEDVDPKAQFSWSRDWGRTWSPELDMSIGKIGEWESAARVYQLGQGENWAFRVRVSAGVKRVITGAYLEAEKDD